MDCADRVWGAVVCDQPDVRADDALTHYSNRTRRFVLTVDPHHLCGALKAAGITRMVAAGQEIIADLIGDLGIELDLTGCHHHPEAGRVDRLLRIHPEIQRVDQRLNLPLRAIVGPDATEYALRVALA